MLPSAIMNPHDANRAFWDASAEWWRAKEDVRGLWRRAAAEPSCVFTPAEMPFVRDVAGKSVCVLGSGDNEAVFAFAGLGGVVTSVDISARRLEIAAERARTLGLTLSFVRATSPTSRRSTARVSISSTPAATSRSGSRTSRSTTPRERAS
jgi:hypothetical protein